MRGARRVAALGCLLAVGGAPDCPADTTTVSYRETPESFSWELRWDPQTQTEPADLRPPRPDETVPRLWDSSLRVSRMGQTGRGSRLMVTARHADRVRELDLPEGAPYRAVLPFDLRPALIGGWARLDRRQLPHLSTPKDTLDTFDVFWKVDVGADGARSARFLVQGAHGTAARAKKAVSQPKKVPK